MDQPGASVMPWSTALSFWGFMIAGQAILMQCWAKEQQAKRDEI
jgi:hypothetical protein